MKNSRIKLALMFLWWILFSAFSVFAANIIISTDFNTATQYLKKIVVLDWDDHENLILDWDNVDIITASGNIQLDWNIFAEEFCQYMSGTQSCMNPIGVHAALNTLNLKLSDLSGLLLWVWTQTWLYNSLENRVNNAELEIQILHHLAFWSENSEVNIPNILQTVYLKKNAKVYWDLDVDRNVNVSWNITINHDASINGSLNIWSGINVAWTTNFSDLQVANDMNINGTLTTNWNIKTKAVQLMMYSWIINDWDSCNSNNNEEWLLVYSRSWNNWNLYICEMNNSNFIWKKLD